MAHQNKTPTTGQTVAGASRFQQSKKILALALHRLNASFSELFPTVWSWLPLLVSSIGLIVLEVCK